VEVTISPFLFLMGLDEQLEKLSSFDISLDPFQVEINNKEVYK